ncbi:DUF4233 domain-containing protein [Gryllotalpicola reticulitermitis]|uniref:DUF4233 domain-containing protein n=1 Tax=Gryllotalpicola reticulitermitis TaxID=1184153 RepID=A0ABV8Q5U5_9MICO
MRQRGVRESLGSIVLGFELIVLFLGALVAWGLHAGPAVIVIVGGAVLVVLCAVGILAMRYRVGTSIGFAVQILAIVSGIWVHMMVVVGLIFLAIWIYAMYQAGKIERQLAAQQSRNGTENQ